MSIATPRTGHVQAAAAVAAADDQAYVDDLVGRSGTSFYWAMRLQPEAKRRAMFAVYAFCREVDDIADDEGGANGKQAQLAEWQHELDELYAGRPRHRLARALIEPIDRFALRKTDFEAILRGMEMDAVEPLRIPDQSTLDIYCDRVACAVGRLSVRVFGAPDGLGDRLADALGNALQRTNILRDLEEDARRDRLYLPAEVLAKAGIADLSDAAAVLRHPGIADVCAWLARDAHQRFAAAGEMLAAGDRRALRPAAVMMQVYQRTLERLMARGWRRLEAPVSLSRPEKLWIAVRYGLF